MMTLNLKPIRTVDTSTCDRIEFLLTKYKLNDTGLKQRFDTLLSLYKANSKSKETKNKLVEILKKIENKLLQNSEYNLVIRNIPKIATSVSTNELIPVTYLAMRDTMKQFGEVFSLEIKYGVVYINMSENVYTHNTINNMQMGNNIICTEIF